jgi:hypothetical protein
LLRSAYQVRIEALARGVQGGIYSPNEARNLEGLPDVKFGDEPRVQQQVVPLSAAEAIPAAPPAHGVPPAGAQPAPGSEQPPKKPEQPLPPEKGNRDDLDREVRNLFALSERIGRRRLSS